MKVQTTDSSQCVTDIFSLILSCSYKPVVLTAQGMTLLENEQVETYTLTTIVLYPYFLDNLKTCLLTKCSKAVLGSPVCIVQTLWGDMGRRYTSYHYVGRSSREDLYER